LVGSCVHAIEWSSNGLVRDLVDVVVASFWV
jgi:hypothetical protein